MGLIGSERRVGNQPATLERRYYLLRLDGNIQRFAQAVRHHWGIENQVYWCLDLAFDEDDSRIRSGHASENMTLIRKIALNLLTQESFARIRKKAKRLKAGWNNNYLFQVLAS
jgi:predicted transposase YbfD/YdcC